MEEKVGKSNKFTFDDPALEALDDAMGVFGATSRARPAIQW